MALSQRERYISFGLMAAGALFTLDRLMLEPYLERRAELVQQIQTRQREDHEADLLLRRADRFQLTMAGMRDSLKQDSSDAEGTILHLMRDWETQADLKNASFLRLRSVTEHGFQRLTFHITGTGTMRGIATLLYRVETCGVPLRVDEFHVTPKNEAGAELQVQVNISTLCLAPEKQRVKAVASIQPAEGQQ